MTEQDIITKPNHHPHPRHQSPPSFPPSRSIASTSAGLHLNIADTRPVHNGSRSKQAVNTTPTPAPLHFHRKSTHDRNRQAGIHPSPSISIPQRTVHISVRRPGPATQVRVRSARFGRRYSVIRLPPPSERDPQRERGATTAADPVRIFLVWILPFWRQIHSAMFSRTNEAAPPSHPRVCVCVYVSVAWAFGMVSPPDGRDAAVVARGATGKS